ncbi:MAG: type I restriction-modification enzyme R subunit C-terminal domain-containing protein, partial [Eubacteriales bacterium]|nr:type I restriction-modification enzyme R subunit C-terminal domain-containing protein [Eubacteriales bacterium]
ICHIAYDQPPLTRKERVNNVRKRNYFTRYGEQARAVLNALLDKYADEGIRTIENAKILKLKPFSDMGTPMEIINQAFGGKTNYEKAVQELEQELYHRELSA